MGLRASDTRLVGAAWPRAAQGRMSLLAELSLNKQLATRSFGIGRIDKQEEGKT